MTTAAAIIGLVSSIVGFIIWLWKRKAVEQIDPVKEAEKYENETRKIIALGDQRRINEYFDDRLRAISRNKQRQGDSANGGGKAVSDAK